jgi:hypothetical protein
VVSKRCEECDYPLFVDLLALDNEPMVAGGLILGGTEAHDVNPHPQNRFR